MTVLTFTKAHDLSQLHDEILALHPSLRGVVVVEGQADGFISLSLPDGVADPGLAAIVTDHVPAERIDPLKAPAQRLKAWATDPLNPLVTRAVVLDILRVLRTIRGDLA